MNGLKSAGVPHRQVLGWFWLGLGLLATIFAAVELIVIVREPEGGFDLLPAFLMFVFLPFCLLMILTGYALLAKRRQARSLIIVLSSLLVVIGGAFLLFRELIIFLYVPTPLLLALGLYGLFLGRRLKVIEPRNARG